MRFNRFSWAICAGLMLAAPIAYAEINSEANPVQPYLNISANNQLDGVAINPNTAASGNFTTLNVSGAANLKGTTTFTSGTTFSSAATVNNVVTFNSAPSMQAAGINTSGTSFTQTPNQNPLVQSTYLVASLASVNAGINILNSANGIAIHQMGPASIMASGNAAGGTSLMIECNSAGTQTILESFAVAGLTNNLPVVYNSTQVEFFSAYSNGCPASAAIFLSASGTFTTATQFFINFPYVQ